MSESSPSPKPLIRRAFGAFLTGVTVTTTTSDDNVPRGFTANSFASVSLEPPMVSICLARTASCYEAFRTARAFAINVMADSQQAVALTFASKATDKFTGVDWVKSPLGSPYIEQSLARFDCKLVNLVEAGDHILLLGQVEHFDEFEASPLGYYRGKFASIASVDHAIDVAQKDHALVVSALLEGTNGILLNYRPDGSVTLPSLGAAASPTRKSLVDNLSQRGLSVSIDFIFSVFDEGETGQIVYRGTVSGKDAKGELQMTAVDAVPWDRLPQNAAITLRRYVSEMRNQAFGIFVGDGESGAIGSLDGTVTGWRASEQSGA
jgi:flavin reductase (DIM6/NTAB) family NADH-FMN oxidoreductase RutF